MKRTEKNGELRELREAGAGQLGGELLEFSKVSLRSAMGWFLFACSLRERNLVNLVDYFRLRRDVRVRGWRESGRFFLGYRCCARWIVFGGRRCV